MGSSALGVLGCSRNVESLPHACVVYNLVHRGFLHVYVVMQTSSSECQKQAGCKHTS